MLVKAWNKQKFVNLLMRLNSYSLVLMMIAYLQLKGYLPYLQDLSASVPESERRTLTFKKYLLKKGKKSSKQNSETEHTADITYEQSYQTIFSRFTPANPDASIRTILQGFFSHYLYFPDNPITISRPCSLPR